MSQTIDDRVVQLTFDNKQFESGVATSLKTLDKLDKSLDLKNGSKGLESIGKAAEGIDLSHLQEGVDALNKKFSVTGTIGRTVVQELTKDALNLAKNGFKKITSSITNMNKQIVEGGKTRASNIANAKFQLKGLGIAWEDISDDINYAVQDTAYGLDSAAKAAAQLSASQVQVGDDMKAALRGISGVAAMTNSSYDDIAQIFTTVAGNGKLMTEQMNQMSYRGLNAAASLAQAFTESEELSAWFYESYTAHAKKNDEAIQEGAAITEKAVRTLVTNGGLDFAHFAQAMDSAFGEHAKEANNTYAGSLSNVKAALSKIGAEFAGPFYNNMINPLNRIKDIFNHFREAVQPAIDGFNELEFVISAKIEKILYNIDQLIPGLTPIAEKIGGFFSNIAKSIGGEEYEVLDKVRAANPAITKTSDVIEKANEALRLSRKENISVDAAIAQVVGTTNTATEATSSYNSELKELAENVDKVDKTVTEGGYLGWDALTAKIKESGGSIEEYEEQLKAVAKEHGYNIEGLLADYGDGFAALFATGELGTDIATEALDQYISKVDETIQANERLKGSAGDYTHTAQEMHDAIQGIWSEKQGKSWEERERLLTEQGFSKAEIDEIHAVVNEMQKSGRTLSSDIDTVYGEIDETIEKSVGYNEQQMKKFARDEEHYVGQAAKSAKKGSKSVAQNLIETANTLRKNVLSVVGDIGSSFSTVFLGAYGKSYEEMSGVEKFFTGFFNVLKVGGQGAWAGLQKLGGAVTTLWGMFTKSPVFDYLSDKLDKFVKGMNDLSWEGIKQKYTDFKNSLLTNPVWTKVQEGWTAVQDFFDKHFDFSKVTNAFKDLSFEKIGDSISKTVSQIKTDGLINTVKSKWTEFKDWIKNLNPFTGIKEWFDNLDGEGIVEKVKNVISGLKESILGLFFGSDAEAAEVSNEESGPVGQLKKIEEEAKNAETFIDKIKKVIDTIAPYVQKVKNALAPLFEGMGINDFLQGGKILAVIGILRQIKKFIKGFEGLGKGVTGITESVSGAIGNFGGIGKSIAGTITEVGKSMSALDKASAREANTAAVRNIAIAIGILAGSLIALANVPLPNLNRAIAIMGGIAGAVVVLTLVMSHFMNAKAKLAEAGTAGDKVKGIFAPLHDGLVSIGDGIKEIGKGIKIAAIAALIMSVVAAIFALYFAIKLYAGLDPNVMQTGFLRVAGVIAALTLSMSVMALACKGAGLGLLGVAPAIIAITAALALMAGVIKLYSLMSVDTFKKGGTMAAAVLIALTAAISIMGLALKKAKPTAMLAAAAMLVTMTASIVVLSAAIVALSLVPVDNLIKGGIAVGAMLVGITAAISVMGKALQNTKATTLLAASVAIVAMTAAVVVLSLALVGLSLIPTGKLLKAAIALGIVMGALKNFAKEASKTKGATAPIVAMAAMIGVISLSLYELSKIKAGDLAGPTAAISVILGFMKGFAKSMNGIASSESVGKSVLGIVAMIGVLASVAGVLYLLGKYGDVEKYGAIASSIIKMLIGLSVSLKVLGSLPPTAGISAAAVIIGFVAVFTGLGMLLAGLDRIPFGGKAGRVTQTLEDAGNMLEKIGEVIGKFIGGFAAGALKALDTVDQSTLDKISSFIGAIAAIDIPSQYEFKWDSEGISFVDKSLVTFSKGMKGICEAVSSLTVPESDEDLERKSEYFGHIADFVSQLAGIAIPTQYEFKWDSEGISYVDTSLKSFSEGMKGVVASVNALEVPPTTEDLDSKRQYFQDVSGFVEGLAAIPIPIQTSVKLDLSAGVYEHIDQSLESFGKGMQEVVTAVNAVHFTGADVAHMQEKKQYFDNIVDFVEGLAGIPIPIQTAFYLSVFDGTLNIIDQSLESFANGMKGVVEAANAVDLGDTSGLNEKKRQFDIIAKFTKKLAELDIPTQTEVDANLSLFGVGVSVRDSSLVTFARGMKAVGSVLNQMEPMSLSEGEVTSMARCVEKMANAAADIKPWNSGIKTLWEDNSLSKFAQEMADAADPIVQASQGATGVNLNNVNTLASAVTAMVPVIEELTKDGAEYSTKLSVVSDYSGLISNIGNAFSSFDGIQNVSVDSINQIPDILDALAKVSEQLPELETNWLGDVTNNPFQNLVTQVNALGDISVNVQNITDLSTALSTLASDSVTKFTSGFDDTAGTVQTAVDGLIQNAVTAITASSESTTSAFEEAGKAFLGALAEGMKDSSGIDTSGSDSSGAQALVTQMANSINSDANKDIFKQAGSGFLSSLAEGMKDTQSVTGPATDAVTAISNAILAQKVQLSTAGRQLAGQLGEGFSKNISAVVTAAQQAGSRAKAGAASYVNAFYSVGYNMGAGLRNGISATVSSIASAAASAVRQAVAAAKNAAAEKSPSKKTFEIGMYMDLGLANGLLKYAKVSNKASAGVANGVIDTLDKVLDIHSPSKVMIKKGKQTIKGYAYGVNKQGKIMTKKTKKAAKKALKNQLKEDKYGQAKRIIQEKKSIENKLKNNKKLSKKEKKMLKKQLKALTKLQKDYVTVTVSPEEKATKAINATNEAIEAAERQRMNSLSAQEKQDYWKKVLSTIDPKEAADQYKEVQNKIADLNKEIENERLESFEKERNTLKERQDVSLADDLKYWKSKQSQFQKGSEAYQKVADKISSINNQIYKSINDSEKTFKDSLKTAYKNLTKQIDQIWKQYEEDVKSRAKTLQNSTGLFDFFESSSYESSDTLLENLRSQTEGLNKFQANLDKIRAKVNKSGLTDKEGFMDLLEEMGPSANANLENLLNMTDKQWNEYIALYNKKASIAQSEARKDVNVSEYNKQVQEAIDDANENIKELTQTYYDGITELGVKISEPSITVGANMVNGMIKGITDNETTLMNTVSNIAKSTMNVAASTLGIHSPSRKFAIFGKQMDMGMVQGLETYKNRVTNATAAVADESLQAMQDAINYASMIGESDYDFSPVITPVLDDSLIAEGMDQMFALFNHQRTIQLSPNEQMMGIAATVGMQQNQNELFNNALERLAGIVADNGGSIVNNNEFNITGNNPREIANEVSRILNKQVQQKERIWA